MGLIELSSLPIVIVKTCCTLYAEAFRPKKTGSIASSDTETGVPLQVMRACGVGATLSVRIIPAYVQSPDPNR